MGFGKEYKKFGQDISPDRDALDRMKSNVMAEVGRRRKPLPLGKIAVSCGSVAACAAIVIAAAVLIPRTDAGNMTAGSQAHMEEINNDTANIAAPNDYPENGILFEADADTGNYSTNKSSAADSSFLDEAADADIAADEDIAEDIDEDIFDKADDTETAVPDNSFSNTTASADIIPNTDSDNNYYEINDSTDGSETTDDTIVGTDTVADADGIVNDVILDEDPGNDFYDDADYGYDFDNDDEYDDSVDEIDDEIVDDCIDSADDLDGSADDFDGNSGTEISKAKFSADRSALRLVMKNGTRLDFILLANDAADVPSDLPYEKFTDITGTEYYLQSSGIYLVLYDADQTFIAVYRVN